MLHFLLIKIANILKFIFPTDKNHPLINVLFDVFKWTVNINF